MSLETNLTRRILKNLKAYGKFIKIHGSPYMVTGTPDILGCFDGMMVCIEVKTPEGSLRNAQRHQLKAWQAAGALSLAAASWEEIEDALKKLKMGIRVLSCFEEGKTGEIIGEVPFLHGLPRTGSASGDSSEYGDRASFAAPGTITQELPQNLD